jgi:hypothetical protein
VGHQWSGGGVPCDVAMSDDELVSRRDLFSGWAKSLAEGIAELVVPAVERRLEQGLAGNQDLVRQLHETLGTQGDEEPHPWRDLLMPQEPRDPEP